VRRLLLHALAYAALLGAVLVVVPLDSSLGSDDGAYGAQVFALRHGSWALQRPVAVVAQDNEGWLNAAVTPAGPTPYTTNPAYPRLLEAVASVVNPDHPGQPTASGTMERAGDLGFALHLPGMAAALVSACLAWRLAGRWDRRAAPVAFWLLASSPILINTTALWAHPLSTATAGTSVVALAELGERRPTGARRLLLLALFTTSLAAGAALRSEAVFWLLAMAIGALAIDRSRAMVVNLMWSAGPALAVSLGARWWGRGLRTPRVPIETSAEVLQGGGGWLATRVPAAWELLITWADNTPGALLTLGALLTALAGAVLVRRELDEGRSATAPAMFLAAATVAYGVKTLVGPEVLITGIAAAWPLMTVALIAGRWPRPAAGSPRIPPHWLLLPAGLLLAAVVITQYASSGGLQWGGRYLSMAYVPLAAAAGVRLAPLLPRRGSRMAGRPLAAALLALGVVPALSGLVASYRLHSLHHEVVATATRWEPEVVLAEIPALPRIAWTALPTAFYRVDPDSMATMLSQLAEAGVATVNVIGHSQVDVDGMAGFRVTATIGTGGGTIRHLTRTSPITPSP
jgi:hypothetical protein